MPLGRKVVVVQVWHGSKVCGQGGCYNKCTTVVVVKVYRGYESYPSGKSVIQWCECS